MGRPFIDIAGQRFGKLVAVAFSHKINSRRFWTCHCDCGATVLAQVGALRAGIRKSCGCLRSDVARTHGESNATRSGMYIIWTGIKQRCLNARAPEFKWYGGRGIAMAPAWVSSFESFRDDIHAAIGVRPSPKHSLDRVNSNGGYEIGNLRWATPQEQQRNRRSNRLISAFGETRCLIEWSELHGVKETTLSQRLRLGWAPERAITTAPIDRNARWRSTKTTRTPTEV